jgi:hypothetical protein
MSKMDWSAGGIPNGLRAGHHAWPTLGQETYQRERTRSHLFTAACEYFLVADSALSDGNKMIVLPQSDAGTICMAARTTVNVRFLANNRTFQAPRSSSLNGHAGCCPKALLNHG